MIVVDTSVFIDLLFEYDSVRTHSAEELFSILEEKGVPILEPDLFKVELSGQIARRVKKNLAPKISEEIFQELVFIRTSGIFDEALSVALETGSRAADSFYIAAARVERAILISNDRFQVESAKESGIEVYNLFRDKKLIEKRCLKSNHDNSKLMPDRSRRAVAWRNWAIGFFAFQVSVDLTGHLVLSHNGDS
jgi:predicted nucleic acid-binding protein